MVATSLPRGEQNSAASANNMVDSTRYVFRKKERKITLHAVGQLESIIGPFGV